MGSKFKLKRKDVKPNLKDKEVDARSKEPLFCFKYLDMKTSLKGCDNSVFKDFEYKSCVVLLGKTLMCPGDISTVLK